MGEDFDSSISQRVGSQEVDFTVTSVISLVRFPEMDAKFPRKLTATSPLKIMIQRFYKPFLLKSSLFRGELLNFQGRVISCNKTTVWMYKTL